jgi:hypothetical protein
MLLQAPTLSGLFTTISAPSPTRTNAEFSFTVAAGVAAGSSSLKPLRLVMQVPAAGLTINSVAAPNTAGAAAASVACGSCHNGSARMSAIAITVRLCVQRQTLSGKRCARLAQCDSSARLSSSDHPNLFTHMCRALWTLMSRHGSSCCLLRPSPQRA